MRCRRVEAQGSQGHPIGGHRGILSDTALRSTEAGLLSILFLSVTFATIGPWFDRTVANILLGLSITAGFFGLAWAHRASHGIRRRPEETAGPYARVGAALSLAGILGSAYYNGTLLLSFFLLIVLLGLLAPVALAGVVMFVTIHAEAKRGEAAFLRGFDPATESSLCLSCGTRAHLDHGRWRGRGWLCARCDAKERRVTA